MSKNSTSNPAQIYGNKSQVQVRKRSNTLSSVNQISSTSRITVQQANCPKALPSLPCFENPANLPFILKQNFKAFSDSISEFFSTASSNMPHYDTLSSRLSDADHFFSIFINLFQKQNTALVQNRTTLSQFPPNSAFGNSIKEFSESLKSLMEVMNKIADNRDGDEARKSISRQFDIISENFSAICNSNSPKTIITKPKTSSLSKASSPNGVLNLANGGNHPNSNASLSSIHNPILKRLKLIEKQANAIRNMIFEHKNLINHHEILNDLRLFSRDINASFSNEFSNSSLSITNKEKIRYSTITACNDIIQGVKNMISRDSMISKIFSKFEIFQNNLNQVFDIFGIPPLSIERTFSIGQSGISKSSSFSDDLLSPKISPSMTLKNIIESSKPYITHNVNNLIKSKSDSYIETDKIQNNDELIQFIDTFFTVISIKADDLVQNDFNLSSQIGDFQLKNAQMASKSRQMEATISELQEKLASQTVTPMDDEGITSEEYMKCLKHVARKLRLYLDDKNTDYLSYNMPQMMLWVEKLSEALSSRTCPTCIEYENAELKVKEILRPILNSISISEDYEIKSPELVSSSFLPGCNGELLPMVLRVQACFDQLQSESKSLRENVESLTNENILLKSSIRKIAKEFNDITITSTTELVSPTVASTSSPKQTKPNNITSASIINIKVKSTNNNDINDENNDSKETKNNQESVIDSIISHIKHLKSQIKSINKSHQSSQGKEMFRTEIENSILSQFTSLFGLDTNKTLAQQFEYVKGVLDTQKRLLNDSQQTLREVEIALTKKLNENDSQSNQITHQKHQGTTVCESVRHLIKKFDTYDTPSQLLVKSHEKHEQILLSNLLAVESTLCGVLKRDPPENLDETQIDQIMSSVIQLSDDVSDWTEKMQRDERKKKPDSIKARATLELLVAKLRKFFNENDHFLKSPTKAQNSEDLTKIETSTLVSSVSEYVDFLIDMNSSSNSNDSIGFNYNSNFNERLKKLNGNLVVDDQFVINADDLNKIFIKILPYVSESARKDPLKFLPEFAFKFSILQESVDSLKPFADVLNDIFESFDCKLKSFAPGSESFAFVRQQVFQLQTLLNAIGPSSVHSLVFSVLSKFVSLISSFLSAISSMSYEEEEIAKKKAK